MLSVQVAKKLCTAVPQACAAHGEVPRRLLTPVHFPVQDGQRLEGVVIGGLQRGHFLRQSKSLILLPSSLQTDGL